MVEVDCTNSEIELLHEVLVGQIADLRMEIACTDRREFREFLYKRRDFMEEFVRRLEKEIEAGGREMIGMKVMENLTQVAAPRLKGPEK